MFGSITKIPTECPHCGFKQNEPAGLISTYCRGCGDHYTVAPRAAQPPSSGSKPKLGKIVREKLLAKPSQRIACHSCAHIYDAPSEMPNSVCPVCGTTIHLHDVEILTHSTRIVQTRGTIHVGRDGFLNATRVICGNAFIEGRIAGKVTCEGTLRLRGSGLCRAKITARRLIIDRGTSLRFTSTLHVSEIVIRGLVEADVECIGTLHIGRYGSLEGNILARSMVVDKGGYYTGEVQVSTSILRPDPDLQEEPEIRVLPATPNWQPDLAFG